MEDVDEDWQPTERSIDALPEPVKRYLKELQSAVSALSLSKDIFYMEEKAAELLRVLQELRKLRSDGFSMRGAPPYFEMKRKLASDKSPWICRSRYRYTVSRLLSESEIFGTDDFEEAKHIAKQFKAYVVVHYPPRERT